MNIDKKYDPTPEENRAAIDALKTETESTDPYAFYRDARAGEDRSAYVVFAKDLRGQNCRLADFWFDAFEGGRDRHAARVLAEQLARKINAS
jgi:hypothetical protein